ncbi:Gfo/Idh/MocA family protein [Thermospira aquatica]|uniref:Gfo/Idh/MocA family oxidoreductase n=1 Tax=Thermospira aquatica TaxID=2828656 RepID=A0AAX3BG66_9SPIR|nr:Gfo/Idh/MocA family oxidoreductase [Thermospira aquatica]URA11178.1 Gfo/Idh/MocA family oxidoreductase [Thermospira aquatica]
MNNLHLGVLGFSRHFQKRIFPALKNAQNITIKALASHNPEKAEAFVRENKIEKLYDSYESLLEDPDIDFVYIPLPNHLHVEWVKKAAVKGKHVLCEKPLGLTSQEVEECIAIAKKTNTKIMEAFMYKFHPQWIMTKKLIQQGEIGKVLSMHCFFGYFNNDADNIRNKQEYGGGALRDIGCYPISAARFLSEKEPQRVIATMKKDERFKTDVLTSAILDFGDFHGLFTVSTQAFSEQKFFIYGSEGKIEILLPFNPLSDQPATLLVQNASGEKKLEIPPVDQYRLEFEAFATSLIENKDLPFSLEDSLSNQKVIDRLFLSNSQETWSSVI